MADYQVTGQSDGTQRPEQRINPSPMRSGIQHLPTAPERALDRGKPFFEHCHQPLLLRRCRETASIASRKMGNPNGSLFLGFAVFISIFAAMVSRHQPWERVATPTLS
jgi:hypothetical protein